MRRQACGELDAGGGPSAAAAGAALGAAGSAPAEAREEVARMYRAKFRDAQLRRQEELYDRAWEECIRRERALAGERAAPVAAGSGPGAASPEAAATAAAVRPQRAAASSGPGVAASEAAAASAGVRPWGQRAEVVFKVRFDTFPGQEMHMVGSCELLGSWDVGRSVHMAWTEGNVWEAKVVFPAGTMCVEYKYVLRKADGAVDWEHGGNHILELPPESHFMQTFDGWGCGS